MIIRLTDYDKDKLEEILSKHKIKKVMKDFQILNDIIIVIQEDNKEQWYIDVN